MVFKIIAKLYGIVMDCKHFGVCGACRNFDSGYEGQLQTKETKITRMFAPFYEDSIELFRSEDAHYRARSEFKIWHDGDVMHYAMNTITRDGVVFIQECPQVATTISDMMPKLLEAIEAKDMKFKLFGVDFLSARSGEMVVSLLYHRKLDEAWLEKAKVLSCELGIHIIGRARKQKLITSQDYVTETLTFSGASYHFRHIENSFTQPNPKVNEKMVTWAMKQFEESSGDLLELYCGAGNFTIPFAKQFDKVLATEISKSSINAAKANMLLNDVTNIEFVRMSAEEFVQALDGVREFRRMKELDLQSYALENIFVDPPRSGMDENSCRFSARHNSIVYISCNPETLVRDLEILTQTHTIASMAIFDQFPYTDHVEMGVHLVKKEAK